MNATQRILNYLIQTGRKGGLSGNAGKSPLTPKQRKRVTKKANRATK
jgi:hypothetical protein